MNELPEDRRWRGIAAQSGSVLCLPEPRNTKQLFGLVVARALQLLTAQHGTVRFVQVGANDGVSADHLHPFIASGHWQGILVEPGEQAFARLQRTYAGLPKLQLVNHAIWTEAGDLPFHVVEGEDGLSSFSLETIMAHAPKYEDLAGMVRTTTVRTETLNGLCDRLGMPRPDLIAVDTEGTDDVVLQSFSLEEHQPGLLLFEHCHLSAERSAALRDRIESAGYRLVHDRHDALAIRAGLFDPGTTDFLADVITAARAG